eukprot:3881468-Pyramimonas_sp.AAC.1
MRPRPVPKRAGSTNPEVGAVEPRLNRNGLSQNDYGGLLGASWGLLWASQGGKLEFSVGGPSVGPLLEPSWGSFGPSGAPLGPSWASLGPSWALLGASWAVLGLGAVLELSLIHI